MSYGSRVSDHLPGCSCCDGALDPVEFAIRSTWPDALMALPPEEREATWGNGNLRRAEGLGAFVRCLMPVHLTGGDTVDFSAWLEVDDDQLRHAHQIWNTPEYAALQLSGRVANGIKPWTDLLGTPGRAEVRSPASIPFLVADEGTPLHRVLHDEWDRDDVLSRIAHALPTTIRERITETWSLERTAGLAPRSHGDGLSFTGAGRTVHLFPYGTPHAMSPAEAIAAHTADAPADVTGTLTEQDGDLHRYAFWRPTAQGPYNLHGFAAVPGHLLHICCVYDNPADNAWALRVWRSIRAE